jgi:uncharacterized membrane protein
LPSIRRFFTLFFAGALLYPALEILFRGFSHISMSFLGGICLVIIDLVRFSLKRVRRIWKALISAVIITQLEFITGMIVNVALGLNVWDYSDRPFEFAGQICLLFSGLWFLLSYLAMAAIDFFERKGRKRKVLAAR